VPLRTELDGLEGYLAVQAVRFQDSLRVSVHVEPTTLDMPVPSLMLQPLVENAIEHGRDPGGVPCLVELQAALVGDRLEIRVRNSRPTLHAPLGPAGFGAGLRNVSQRLEAAYGGAATLLIGPGESGSGTVAVLTLPSGGSHRLDAAEGES
jgi:two-component system LytT family sensor kinase